MDQSNHLAPGGQIGFNWLRSDDLILGLEVNFIYNYNQVESLRCHCQSHTVVYDLFTAKKRSETTILGRFAHPMEHNFLPYLFTGVGLADMGMSYKNEFGDHYAKRALQTNWQFGAGIEWRLPCRWSVATELFYMRLDRMDMTIPQIYSLVDENGSSSLRLSTMNLRLKLNYHF